MTITKHVNPYYHARISTDNRLPLIIKRSTISLIIRTQVPVIVGEAFLYLAYLESALVLPRPRRRSTSITDKCRSLRNVVVIIDRSIIKRSWALIGPLIFLKQVLNVDQKWFNLHYLGGGHLQPHEYHQIPTNVSIK